MKGEFILSIEEIKELIEKSGQKKWFIANKTMIPVQRLGSFLSGKNTLSDNQMHRLHKYLEHVKSMSPWDE